MIHAFSSALLEGNFQISFYSAMSGGEHLSICEDLAKVLQQCCEKLCVACLGCEAVARKLRESCDMRKITSRTCLPKRDQRRINLTCCDQLTMVKSESRLGEVQSFQPSWGRHGAHPTAAHLDLNETQEHRLKLVEAPGIFMDHC
jgi:hypothetical protein